MKTGRASDGGSVEAVGDVTDHTNLVSAHVYVCIYISGTFGYIGFQHSKLNNARINNNK
jgi:hypothetical protein